MFAVDIPGMERLEIDHLVLDYNGTIALDGDLIQGVPELMVELSTQLTIHVLTADTHGTVREKLEGLPCLLHVISPGHQNRPVLRAHFGIERQGFIQRRKNRQNSLRSKIPRGLPRSPSIF